MTPSDGVFLQAAIALAEQGRFTCAPNPTVGCIIVRQGEIIGRGYHHRTGEAHAEVNAIADAGGDVEGATVYVSLEPCAFVGRTPACAQTLIDHRVARVVAAAQDPHLRVAGKGLDMLRAAGIEANLITQPEALEILAGYISRITKDRPLVRVKSASSLDGAIALASGESQWITRAEAREDVQYWRARSDAIISGVGTVLADDPRLTVRTEQYRHCKQPLRVILDTELRTPEQAKLLHEQGPVLFVHAKHTKVPAYLENPDHIKLLALEEGPADLGEVLSYLGAYGCNEVLVEAGAQVAGSFLQAGLWDEWLSYIAPKWLGDQSRSLVNLNVATLADAPMGELIDVIPCGQDVRVRIAKTAQRSE